MSPFKPKEFSVYNRSSYAAFFWTTDSQNVVRIPPGHQGIFSEKYRDTMQITCDSMAFIENAGNDYNVKDISTNFSVLHHSRTN